MQKKYQKSTLLMLLGLLLFFKLSAQDVERIKLNAEGRLLKTLPVENGVVFITIKGMDIKITRYSNSFEKEWSKDLDVAYRDTSIPLIETVTTPSGKFLFTTQVHSKGYHNKTHYINKLDSEGKQTKFEIEGRDELGKELQAIFCNDDYFYYLATDNGDQKHDRKKRDEKLILNSFGADDFSYSRKILDLPPVEGEEQIFWEFIGHTDSEFYVASKKVDYRENFSEVTIITFDNKGNRQRSFKLNVNLENAYIRPARLDKTRHRIFSDQENLDYTINPQNGSIYPTWGGFTGVYFGGDHIYLYGLLGPDKFKKVAAKYEGAYVIKYDLKGELVWKKELTDNADLINNKKFNKHNTPGLRGISLVVLPDETINFNIDVAAAFSGSLYKYIISADGLNKKVEGVDISRKSYKNALALYYDDAKNHGKQFIKTTDIGNEKGTIFGNLLYNNLEVLYELNVKGRQIKNIYLLKK
ncbi:hypothetical protein JKA74_01500 [Marivirga sp. S37H4]|uniref:Uncharacterized protein n=1 Tax=Marivirga aurantiaca TaxID=2802615 RepID=A0A935C597_9BACT|nr:hypothetical protein [Marivirga aurantiaca]MBK6263694.1 hypothetical protein [Marivirga aurantiaca]